MSTNWMEQSQQGRVSEILPCRRYRVGLHDGRVVEASAERTMRERGDEVVAGDTVLLRPTDGGDWEIARRFRFEGQLEPPLIVPAVDPEVEYLLAPGEDGWQHPYKPVMYDWYDAYDRDLPMWRRLAEEEGDPILELACGTGRVAIELARAGHTVTGVDISQPMLDRAAEKLTAEDKAVRRRVRFVHADMVTWSARQRFRLGFIACNGLHYMASGVAAGHAQLCGRSLNTLHAHLAPGGLGAASNVAPIERKSRTPALPAPYLVLNAFDVNPHTGLWTAEYVGWWTDNGTGQRYDGPWRFVEYAEDGNRRAFEFAPPPEQPGELRLPDRPEPLTRSETIDLMQSAGFRDIDARRPPDLEPLTDEDALAVFLGRK